VITDTGVGGRAEVPEAAGARPPRVLVVEDELLIAMDLQRMLRESGYDVVGIAATAELALGLAAAERPDLVLMDIRIRGDVDGIATARVLQHRFRVPVIYVTAYADDATIERAKATNPFAYLLKPIKPAELKTAVEVTLHRHSLERRLRERERWLTTTLGSLADAVLSFTVDRHVAFANRAAEALLAAASAPLLGAPLERVLAGFAPEHRLRIELLFSEDVGCAQVVELPDAELVSPTLGGRFVSGHGARVLDDNTPLGVVVVLRDVTEQRRARGQAELSERLVALGTLAAGLAHEINNPLAVVIGNSGVVLEELLGLRAELESASPTVAPALREPLELSISCETASQTAARRIAHVVSELHAFARASPSGGETADLDEAVDRAVKATAVLFGDRATVTIHLERLPVTAGAPAQLARVLINLLANAADAIAPGRPLENRVIVSTRSDARGRTVLEVSDTGHGIPAEHLGRVFDPFFTTKPPGYGLGLGLSVSRSIVSSLGGSIEVTSRVGQGTTLRVVLEAVASVSATKP